MPEFKLLRGNVPNSFAYFTIKDRMPTILTKVINSLSMHMFEHNQNTAKIKEVISHIAQLKYNMTRNKALPELAPLPENELYNRLINKSEKTWFDAPWLLDIAVESALDIDLFYWIKKDAFKETEVDLEIGTLASMVELILWGNQSDLSLHINGREEGDVKQSHIIVNHIEPLCRILPKEKTIVYVLDNAGFELYTDLLFATLLTRDYDTNIIFECKQYPWFVSDVTSKDFYQLINSKEKYKEIWQGYLDSGKWQVRSHWFWTTPLTYSEMETEAPDLYHEMKESFAIYKGDLNYRKVTTADPDGSRCRS
ncbi:hypothetical protein HK103_003534 [Boothiomyces macroporosus]|uniref:Sugar phosphate phosphatase n=1 Tax=Boothiomyces macroporosus TaxID=261099 RepID=A0AAD5UHV3_9FUNG|nr:hypothetical protein HK103_003534 [Boothiomyces macroporosus]